MFKRIIILLLIFTIIIILSLYVVFTPPYVTQLHFQHSQIKIIRDQYAIPHIHSPNRRGFLYAWGYALAQDRLFQASFRKYYAAGRLSQFLGPRTLQADIMMRDLSLIEIGISSAKKMKAENSQMYWDLLAFCQGINDQVANRLALPFQFYLLGMKWEPWTIVQLISLSKLLEWSLSHNMVEQFARSSLLANHSMHQLSKIIPNTKETWAFPSQTVINDEDIPDNLKSKLNILNNLFQPLHIEKIVELGMPEFFISAEGSNGWVVKGEHTQSGKPILSGDPHLDSAIPSHWYQLRATYTHNNKTIRYAGVAPPGIMVTYGRTEYFATAMTVVQTDTQDLFREKLRGNQYLVDGQWKNLRIRNQTILIKEGSTVRQYNHTVRFTHRGPILNLIVSAFGTYELTEPLSICWTGFNQGYQSFFNTGFYAIEIDNFEQLKTSLISKTSHFLSLSMIFATSDNHILYQQSGLNPIRRNHTSGSYIKDGTSTKDDWIGFIPADQRMHVSDPKSGYLVSGNNRVASNQYRGGYFQHMIFTARADRLQEVLAQQIASGRKITNQFAVNLLFDTVDVYCRQILPQIVAVSPKAQQILANFDCNFKPDSYQATIYEVFLLELYHKIKPLQTHNVSLLAFHVFQQCAYNAIHQAFAGDMQKKVAIHRAWDQAYKNLTQFFKTTDHTKWRWGAFHRDIMVQLPLGNHPLFKHIYNLQTQGWGNFHTPNVAKPNKVEFGDFRTSHRANMRSIYDFGGPSWWVIDGGISQNIFSNHYDDQWKIFMAQKLLPLWEENDKEFPEL